MIGPGSDKNGPFLSFSVLLPQYLSILMSDLWQRWLQPHGSVPASSLLFQFCLDGQFSYFLCNSKKRPRSCDIGDTGEDLFSHLLQVRWVWGAGDGRCCQMRLQPEHPLCNLLLLLDLLASYDLYDPGLLQSLQVAEKIFLFLSHLALQGGCEAEEGNVNDN